MTTKSAAIAVLAAAVSLSVPGVRSTLPVWYSSAGELRQRLWNRFLDVVGDDPEYLFFVGSWVVFFAPYWILGSVYTLMDVVNRPEALRRYKVQPGTNEPVDRRRLMQVVGQVLFNQTVVSLPVMFVMSRIICWSGTSNVRDLPSVHAAVVHIAGCVLVEEFGFYYTHRLLHHRSLYKYVHKKHHEWTSPISVVAIYSHPVEHVLSNLLPPALGVVLFDCHVSTAWAWFALAVAFTLGEHSGYHLPFMPSSEAHDYHHFKFNNCYGVLGLLDAIHGTDLNFKAAVNYRRHRLLTGLASARELYPDAKAD